MEKNVLITGATGGLGYEFAKKFANNNYNLILVGRDLNRLNGIQDDIKNKYNVSVTSIVCDMSKEEQLDELCDKIKNLDIDILINNAGFNIYGEFIDTDFNIEKDIISVNIIALTKLTKVVSKKMKEKKSGKILNLGSTASFIPLPFSSVYAATKSYVLSFSQALNYELRNTGITVTTLCPGPTHTNFAKSSGMEHTSAFKKHVMNPTDVVNVGYDALIKGKSRVIPGIYNKTLVFGTKLAPINFVLKAVSRFVREK